MSKKRIKPEGAKREKKPRGHQFAGRMRTLTAREQIARQVQANEQAAKVKHLQTLAKKQAEILAEVSEEVGYQFAGLELADQTPENVQRFRDGMLAAMQAVGAEDGKELTPEAEAAIVAYNQAAVEASELVPRNIRLGELPKARVYPDGRIEACGPAELDIRGIAKRMQDVAN